MSQAVLGLDVGSKRIGIASGTTLAGFANPLVTLENDEHFFAQLGDIVREQAVTDIVVGLPRGLDGQETAQTAYVYAFIEQLKAQIPVPIHLQDEAVTSVNAEAELEARGKQYTKGDIDALAATYILQDYLDTTRST